MKATQKVSGFTIVELLIVIVVIAVLASVTVVAFNGVQQRANAAKAAELASMYARSIKMYYTTNGTFPTSDSPISEVCLGEASDFPASPPFDAGQCLYSPYSYRVDVYAPTAAAFKTIASSAPSPILTPVNYGSEVWRGFRYVNFYEVNTSYRYAAIEWIIGGTNTALCKPGTGSVTGSNSYCRLQIDI